MFRLPRSSLKSSECIRVVMRRERMALIYGGNIGGRDVPSPAALAAAAMRRATFGSDHRGHGRLPADYYYHDDDTDYQLHPKYARPRYNNAREPPPPPVFIDELEKLDACYYGYKAGRPTLPVYQSTSLPVY